MNKEHRRSKTGCQTCRSKRKKCDESKPNCQRCVRTGSTCKWANDVRFRYQHIPGVPTIQETTRTAIVANNHETTSSPDQPMKGLTAIHQRSTPRQSVRSPGYENDQFGFADEAEAATARPSPQYDQRTRSTPSSSPNTVSLTSISRFNSSNTLATSPSFERPSPVVVQTENDLQALRNHEQDREIGLVPISEQCLPDVSMFNNSSSICSPDVLTDDGIFIPGSTYQELHKVLRSHQIFHTAQQATDSQQPSTGPQVSSSLNKNPSDQVQENANQDEAYGTSTPPELPLERELLLWDNWVNEIGPWLDKFDHDQHHRHTLPAMAQSIPHLKYSMLALSARQLERKKKSLPTSTSLELYQWAIHLLLPVMHTKQTAVLASCVVLCVFEMSSCSPKAWRRHLDGCASLIMAMDIRGDCGGLEQSLFWNFARMDVCGGLISSDRPLIPVHRWISGAAPDTADIGSFTTIHFEDHASHACHLLARVLDLLHGTNPNYMHNKPSQSFIDSWLRLFDELNLWHRSLPTEMRPVLSLPASTAQPTNPFPTLLFSSGAAVSGNQLYHTAMLLMLQRKPKGVSVESRSILWHARQICAISMSNSHHGAWTNSVQPLWLAGQLMSHPSEHRAIVELYARIERETGWGATWRAVDLQEHWGDLS